MNSSAVSTRIQIEHVLFATDFSDVATAALPFAAEIARCFGANLYVVHAKTLENYASPTPGVWPAANAELENNTEEVEMALQRDFQHSRPTS